MEVKGVRSMGSEGHWISPLGLRTQNSKVMNFLKFSSLYLSLRLGLVGSCGDSSHESSMLCIAIAKFQYSSIMAPSEDENTKRGNRPGCFKKS